MKIVSEMSVLRKKSEEVASVSEARAILEQLTKELAAQETGIGLSAIQIGIPKRISILRNDRGEFYPIINPVVVETSDEFEFLGEGCLSFPGIFLNTKRFRDFVIKNQVIDGDSFREETHYFHYENGKQHLDIECIAAQHEIDHLDGILFFDREAPKQLPIVVSQKVGRNDPCPCGSGKKYKKCCG